MFLNLLFKNDRGKHRYGMSNLIERVGGSIDSFPGGENFASWTEELSPGEMQIISFLRLLYHHQTPLGK